MVEETGQKKVVGRTIAIVLGIICIVLSAGIVVVLAAYLPAQGAINSLNSQVATQNATITSQSQQISALQNSLSQIGNDQTDKDAQIADLNSQLQELTTYYNNLLLLNASGILVLNQGVSLPASGNSSIWNDYLDYAGYVVVQVQSSSNTTFANVVYSTNYGVNFNEVVVVGTSGSAVFPVLPGLIDVRVGNTEPTDTVSATVAAIYHY